MPAGRALVVIVAALVLAALVNADDLVARAERRPLGPERDRSLAVWHPVQGVSHVLQLYRLRQIGDWVVGDDRGGSGDPAAAVSAGTTSASADPPTREVQLRAPTPDEPLRLWVGGDSMSQTFGESLVRMAEETGVVEGMVHAEISSGLTRPDYYDWPDALAADVADQRSEVVVALFGANDAQGILLPDGTPVPDMSDPRWAAEYGRRVAAVMDQLYQEGRLVVWVLQPTMRDADFDARIDVINGVYAQAAASRPWVVVVDATDALGDEAGRYAELLASGSGGVEDVRQDDGVHLTRAGADRLAADVLRVVMARANSR
jgi:uncharacterized protein